jgi:predicted nucleic acid-binding protein
MMIIWLKPLKQGKDMTIEKVFIDTSAFYALMDRSDSYHQPASKLWTHLLDKGHDLKTSNYVTVETLALLQNRLGFEAADLWSRDVLGIVETIWIDEVLHNLAFEIWFSLGRRKLSLVDCASFVLMRHDKVEKVFGFDKHFTEHGFEILNEPALQ